MVSKLVSCGAGIVLIVLAIVFALSPDDGGNDGAQGGGRCVSSGSGGVGDSVVVKGGRSFSSHRRGADPLTLARQEGGQSRDVGVTGGGYLDRALEYAKRPAPVEVSEVAKELWELNQRERVAMLEIRRDTAGDPGWFIEKRGQWRRENVDLLIRRKELQEMEREERRRELIDHAKPEEAELLKRMQSLQKSMKAREISMAQYREEIIFVKNDWETMRQQARQRQKENFNSTEN